MHVDLGVTVHALNKIWDEELQAALDVVKDKIGSRGHQYEKTTPVWMSLTNPSDYQTMLKIKSRRIISELEGLESFDNWDPDNAIDIIAYAAFLVAYASFTKRRITKLPTKGTE